MIEVVYFSLTGHTRKVAEAIAAELRVTADDVKTKDGLADDSLVFLGAGLYGPLKNLGFRRFIAENDFRGRKVALFGTSGEGRGKEVGALEEAVTAKGAEVAGRFFCKGSFLYLVNRGRPNRQDLEDARTFAREVTG
jgi:flavodoxin I